MPLPAPGALHRDPFTAAGGIHFLHRDAPEGFLAKDSGGIFVDEGATLAALAIYRDRLVVDAFVEGREPTRTKRRMMLSHSGSFMPKISIVAIPMVNRSAVLPPSGT